MQLYRNEINSRSTLSIGVPRWTRIPIETRKEKGLDPRMSDKYSWPGDSQNDKENGREQSQPLNWTLLLIR